MTLTTILTLLLSASAALLATFAYVVARRGSGAHQSRRLDTLQQALSELADSMQAQESAIMNLRARLTMQATREKRRQGSSDSSPPSENASTDEEKARIRRELSARLANDSIKPPGR